MLPRGTLVERTTHLALPGRMGGMDTTGARQGVTKTLCDVPAALCHTLPCDWGKEMAEHEQVAQRLTIQSFFADPYSPW